MSYNREDYVRIKAEFAQKSIAARRRADARQMELYGRIPEVIEIDRLLSKTGREIMAVIAKGGDVEKGIADIREKNEILQKERGELLRKNGYPENYSDVQYECKKCDDTGYVDTKMCDCMRRALVLAGYESSGIGGLIQCQSFDNFSLEYYQSDGGNYEGVRCAYQNLRAFAEGFNRDTYRNHLLIGGTGLGKTHLSTSVAKTVIDRGFDVMYVTATAMLADFETKRFGNGLSPKHNLDRYFDAELLIVDDLGTETVNQFTLSCVYEVINERINRRKSTIINTNLSKKDLEARYNERIASRLFGEYIPFQFLGRDIRQQKILKRM
ncbi:MAG: ATP-binding protein [Clostridia bacterium]|nr:ATP-binding protein [Clostridia bacterium]